jgi:hypothetical protein
MVGRRAMIVQLGKSSICSSNELTTPLISPVSCTSRALSDHVELAKKQDACVVLPQGWLEQDT